MSIYTGVSDTAKKITAIYAGVNGTARKIVRAYAGDANGVARLVYSAGWRDKYQQVEYIQGDGNAYINTGYYITSTTRMEVDFQFWSTSISAVAYAFGGYKSSRFGVGANTSNYITFGMGNGYGRRTINTNKHTAVVNSATHAVSYDGANVSAHSGTYSAHSGSDEWLGILGGLANDGSVKCCPVRMYHLFIKPNSYNSDIIHDYYPVYRKSDNEPGVYDIIDGIFYSNSGSGTITVGSDYEGEL